MSSQKVSADVVIAIIKQHQPCTSRKVWQSLGEELVSRSAVQVLIMRLKACGTLVKCGIESNAYIYQLTNISPYVSCTQCCTPKLRWHLIDNKCAACRPKQKGCSPLLHEEFKFLDNPAYKIVNQALRP